MSLLQVDPDGLKALAKITTETQIGTLVLFSQVTVYLFLICLFPSKNRFLVSGPDILTITSQTIHVTQTVSIALQSK